ncbi:MAG: Protein kinase domain protein [Labilithrix sp.]|nr:Protein kinase domain protein [Labilithrix sp.]
MSRRLVLVLLVATLVGVAAAPTDAVGKGSGCPANMALVSVPDVTPYCIDRWEAEVLEVNGKSEAPHAPTTPVTGLTVRAVTRPGAIPQGYISKNEAEAACKRSHKRLCTGDEWDRACRGKKPTAFPYGDDRKAGYCNDSGRAPLASLYPELGENVYASPAAMNDPRINKAPNTVAPTGSFPHCRNAFGVFDMVGNLHEWIADVHDGSRGTFRGGYYQDTHLNGDGCTYRTTAHDVSYHDYSTGFRCCADAR